MNRWLKREQYGLILGGILQRIALHLHSGPDVFLSLPMDWSKKENRSYFFWEFGKPFEVAIEIVSNREGSELDHKLLKYARLGVTYYTVFDPLRQIQEPEQMDGHLLRAFVLSAGRYQLISETPAG
ncbi:MAG: Uma2 family endonuclease, partial [Cyanobacteria bacterium P01_D01_bin.44]